MEFLIKNKAGIAHRWIRFAQWKLRKVKTKLNHLLYSEIFVPKESVALELYTAKQNQGVANNDIIISSLSNSLISLWKDVSQKTFRHLRKHKERLLQTRQTARL